MICLSSHVAYGAVGNRIMVPALEALGLQVTAFSTVQLPWHPGLNARYGTGTRIVADDSSFAAMIDNFIAAPWLQNIQGMVSGYLGSPAQAKAIARLVVALKHANPDAIYLCDPVIGDNGGLYVPEVTANAIRDELWPLADIVTPNRFEFGWMIGQPELKLDGMIKAAFTLEKRQVVVTSVDATENEIGTLLVAENAAQLISHEKILEAPNGTGDLLAALFLGFVLQGDPPETAVKKAATAVLAAIKDTGSNPNLEPKRLQYALAFQVKNTGVEIKERLAFKAQSLS